MNYDFNVTNIGIAIYVEPGTGTGIHKNRALHGIAVNISPDPDDIKKYITLGKFIPIYVHSNGEFQFRVKLNKKWIH